ncbi:MAG: hypothetical protein LBD79_01620 [Treponema sp.]|nr:hypothetical protein [Treponema sp.]
MPDCPALLLPPNEVSGDPALALEAAENYTGWELGLVQLSGVFHKSADGKPAGCFGCTREYVVTDGLSAESAYARH